MSGARFLLVMAASLLVSFAGLNLFSGAALDGLRLDLTERGLYQLSPGAREVLARIDEPVELTFYYSRSEAARYPAIRAYGARVREMLRTIAARSGGRVRLEEIDPDPFSAQEDAAISAGLEPIPTEDGGQIFFGLTGRNAVDDQRVIAFFDPVEEARLEYEIVRTLAELERAQVPRIAVISDLPFAPDREGNSDNRIIDELASAFDVDWLESDFETIPEDADALFILHPAPLEEAQSYLVDQFALTTGRVLALVDPMAHVALKRGPDGLPPVNANRASTLSRLFASWGVAYDVNTTAMDARNGLPVQIVEGGRAVVRHVLVDPHAGDDPQAGRGVGTAQRPLVEFRVLGCGDHLLGGLQPDQVVAGRAAARQRRAGLVEREGQPVRLLRVGEVGRGDAHALQIEAAGRDVEVQFAQRDGGV
ncbi:MAG: GldG family protein, partial [Oceanicaulis sp.]